ncbi:glycosyltransferase family 4 protein [Mesonia maritima]|uniref:GalNAc-alpha-(1->4)-GalNAc-alpha-(1->3)-diNAcBac-PP-undecaprenol alpha-1,4-N-acetyl-D-galactosaminyltransferase n=1 Tax=Mesonia maritima TaxID=1793873 RepID=A0ABU1K944_9FLAO|nr:glycosyltransferase family 4 protein [Mesonia maritima]MDR6301795.1 GalNAc-alpha-(1->4)-GalNAc-alpha-(1->3)-diNAcBac-PP-undecaprenol alpha-1,4-N-acetyl-D-galactosaminyltransferase [Mesonia maritima]
MINRILITVPTLEGGGMERAALNFAIALKEKGFLVKIFTVSNDKVYFDIPNGIEIIHGKKRTKDIYLIPISLYKLRKLAKSFQPNIVLSFSGKISPYIILALVGVKTSTVPFHRSSPYVTYGKLNNILSSLLYPKCKSIVVQTSEAKSIFEDKFQNKNVIVVPNPIRKLNIDKNTEKQKIIINVSRLVKGKGLDNLIEIFYSIGDKDWNLYILGDGCMRQSLEDLVVKLNIQDKVKFLGFQKNVDYYLSKSSIFAFTSESEGFPNSLLEAMCAGVACVSFDCPTGPSEMIINGKNGFLIEMGNNKEFSEKLEKLMNNEDLRNKFSIEAKKLNDYHNPEVIMSKFISDLQKRDVIGDYI